MLNNPEENFHVLMVNRPNPSIILGGDLVQMHATARELRKLGVRVTVSHELRPDLRNIDLVHAFNLETPASTLIQVAWAKKNRKPVLLSTIFFDIPDKIRFTNFFHYGNFTLTKKIIGKRICYSIYKLLQNHLEHQQQKLLGYVNYLLPNSQRECDSIFSTFPNFARIPVCVIPNGIYTEKYKGGNRNQFKKKYGVTDFLLVVGRIGYLKNQLQLLRALRSWNSPIVLIGQQLNAGYFRACVQEAHGRNVIFIPHLPPEEIRNAYAAAKVHALPSQKETVGLASMEAAVAGCQIVVSPVGGQKEYFGELAEYCDPNDLQSIRSAVERAWAKGRNQDLGSILEKNFTWAKGTKQTLKAYCTLLNR